jgi:hypothetical protein
VILVLASGAGLGFPFSWGGPVRWGQGGRVQFIASIILALVASSFFSLLFFDLSLLVGLYSGIETLLGSRDHFLKRRQNSGINRTGRLFGGTFFFFISYQEIRDWPRPWVTGLVVCMAL